MINSKQGNMYPDVDECWCPLRGACSHKCSYCYVASTTAGRCGLYSGILSLSEKSMRWQPRPESKVIFVVYMNDLFAADVPEEWIRRIMERCCKFARGRTLMFQTKNPRRAIRFRSLFERFETLGGNYLLGVTLETNRPIPQEISDAPSPFSRYDALLAMPSLERALNLFVTIEPIMDFDLGEMSDWLKKLRPLHVNIGADSKGHQLQEPPLEKVIDLIAFLKMEQIEVREKNNLGRLFNSDERQVSMK